jgi:hypothetical protein
VLGAPIFERCISFALPSGKTGTDHVKWHDLDFGDSGDKTGLVQVVDNDFNLTRFGNRFALCLVRPKKRRPSALSPVAGTRNLTRVGI